MCHASENSEIQDAVFSKTKTLRNLYVVKDLFLDHLQPPGDINPEEITILSFEFENGRK